MAASKNRKKLLHYLAVCLAVSVAANAATDTPIEHVTTPDGKTIYYIMRTSGQDADGNSSMAIEESPNNNASFHVLLNSSPSDDPQKNLTNFSNLFLSTDSKTLYFQAEGWATGNAIHALDLKSGKVSFITGGNIACVVSGGKYQGDLVVQQHRYFVQGGSYDDLYLYDPSGKEMGLVSQNPADDPSKICLSL